MIRLGWCRWSLVGLIIVQVAWFGWLVQPEGPARAIAVLLAVGPLALALAFAWRLQPRPLVLTGLLLLVYFSIGVMEAWANPETRIASMAQVALVLLYFTGLATIRRQPPPTS